MSIELKSGKKFTPKCDVHRNLYEIESISLYCTVALIERCMSIEHDSLYTIIARDDGEISRLRRSISVGVRWLVNITNLKFTFVGFWSVECILVSNLGIFHAHNLKYIQQLHDNRTLITVHLTSHRWLFRMGILVRFECTWRIFDSSTTSRCVVHSHSPLWLCLCRCRFIITYEVFARRNITRLFQHRGFHVLGSKWQKINIPFYFQHTMNGKIYRLSSG